MRCGNYRALEPGPGRRLGALLLGAAAAAAVSCGTLRAAEHAARLEVDRAVHDFGDVPTGRAITHVFTLRNSGDLALRIAGVETPCGCMTTAQVPERILPGATAPLAVRLDLEGRSGFQHKRVFVVSNDPLRPRLTLTLRGRALPGPLRAEPPRLLLGQAPPGSLHRRAVELDWMGEGALRLLSVTTGTAAVSATLETLEAGRRYRVSVTARMPRSGVLEDELHVRTDHDRYPSLTVPISGAAMGAVTALPRQLSISRADGRRVTRTLILRPGTAGPFAVLKVETPERGMTAEVTSREGGFHIVRVHGIEAAPRMHGRQVIIHTDLAELPVVSVPIEVGPRP